MKKILHIVASPRGEHSRSLQVGGAFLETFLKSHSDWIVDELNLWKEPPPQMTLERVDGKYSLLSGKDLSDEMRHAWEAIIQSITRFTTADAYLISTPMWNFGLPYILKQYLDVIVQPKYLFQYTKDGPEGLVKNKKLVICTSRGGDYSEAAMHGFDFVEPCLRSIFGFVGFMDITFVNAQPMDMGPEFRDERLGEAMALARGVANRF